MAASTGPDPRSFLPLSLPVFRILLALSDQTLHGYAIMQAFAEKTGGRERLLPGTLYSSLARMAEDGLVEELDPPRDQASGGPQRRYYRRTPLGKAVAAAEAERMRVLVDVARAERILPESPK